MSDLIIPTKVTIDGEVYSVTEILEKAFLENHNLSSVIISDSITAIGDYAFSDCYASSIIIGDGVTSIGASAFSRCKATSIIIGDNVTSLGANAFEGSSIESLVIGNGITVIEENTFNNSSLKSVILGDNIVRIGEYAFAYCSSLSSITIPSSVLIIGSWAFYGCTSLETVTNLSVLPIEIGSDYYGSLAVNATSVLGDDSDEKAIAITDEDGYVLYASGDEVILVGYVGTSQNIVIPDGVTIVDEYAFGNKDIATIIVPESVTYLGSCAFGWSTLQAISFLCTTPPSNMDELIYWGNGEARVFVPDESVELYEAEEAWWLQDVASYKHLLSNTSSEYDNYDWYGQN